MILFMDDWNKPVNSGPDGIGPIVDTQTKNTSFLNYASLLQQMGVKNWAFPLALHDPTIQGLDPLDEDNLTDEQKYRIGLELSENPWYYLREAAKVPASAGSEPLRFRAHRANIGMFWLFMNCVSFFLLQPRQTGKSVVADMINNYLIHYRMWNTDTILITLTQQLLSANIERIKDMRSLLPQYTLVQTDKDTKAKELYTYPARGNNLLTRVSQNSEASANTVGRGCTTAVQQYDEAAMINYVDVIWSAAMPATGAARDTAREIGAPYGTMITTTAGDKMSRSGKFMYNIYTGCASWTEHYFDLKDRDELHQVIRKNSRDGDLMVGATFNHLQLGFTDTWLRDRIAEMRTTDIDAINRDYFNVWTAGGALSPLPPEITHDILLSEKNPKYVQITKDGYIVKWYVEQERIGSYMRENHCVIGADTSEAVNRDATSFVIVNISTLEVVAALSVSEADVIKLADFVVDFMVSFPRTTLIIEHKSTGGTFIEMLYTKLPVNGIDPFRRIYNVIVQDKDKHPELFKQIQDARVKRNPSFYTQNKKKFGFTTTGASRHTLYKEVLQTAGKRCRHLIYDKTLSAELRSLEVDPDTGRIDHSSEGHDDNVIAWLLAMWLLMYGKNLSFYGIESRRVMSSIQSDGKLLDDTASREAALIEAYQVELEELTNKLAENEKSVYRLTIEHQIKRLLSKLSVLGVEAKNIDTLLAEIKEKRKNQIRERHNAAISRMSSYGY